MAHARGLVGVRPLFAMRFSLVHGPRPRSKDRELTMDCRHCGNVRDEARETVPYVGPGPRVVELRDVHVTRCRVCAHMTVEVPEPSHLDTLIRCLGRGNRRPVTAVGLRDGPLVHPAAPIDGVVSDTHKRSLCPSQSVNPSRPGV